MNFKVGDEVVVIAGEDKGKKGKIIKTFKDENKVIVEGVRVQKKHQKGNGQETGGIIEIKCPFNPAVHLKHFLFEKPEDLKEDNLQYYTQCQYNMICVEREFGYHADFCDFISYDPRTSKSKQLKVLRIPADKEMQKMLLERTMLAVEYLRSQIEKINKMEAIINEYQ